MSLKHHNLDIGDSVMWINPDTGDLGDYRIQEILEDTGRIKNSETLLVIVDDASGHCEEVSVGELH